MSKQSELQCFKWTGSKWLIAKDVVRFLPDVGGTYYEPFLGGGAMLLSSVPNFKRVVGGDLYSPLIELWKSLRDNQTEVIEKYSELWTNLKVEVENIDVAIDRGKNYPELFYKCREEFNKNANPLLLLFLTKTCLNGVIRFSKSGKFNNSFHHGRLGQKPLAFSKCVNNLTKRIRHADFYAVDASDLVQEVKKDDFVFLDPPYFASQNRYIDNYSLDQLEALLEFLNSRCAHWICTYDSRNDVSISKELFKTRVESQKYQSRIRRVSGRGLVNTSESIYLNFETDILSCSYAQPVIGVG